MQTHPDLTLKRAKNGWILSKGNADLMLFTTLEEAGCALTACGYRGSENRGVVDVLEIKSAKSA